MNNSLQYRTKIDSSQPMHIYYDIDIINNDQQNGEESPNLVFNEVRNNPFINCPSNYYCSIVRFSIQTPSLPIMIPQVLVGQSDINKLIYQISISQNEGGSYTQNINYIPSNSLISLPAPPTTAQDLTNDYYYVYSVNDWIRMLNNTLSTVAIAMELTNAPFFYFDVNTSLLQLYVPQAMASGYKIWVNKQLMALLATFQFKFEQSGHVGIGNNGVAPYFNVYNDNGINSKTVGSVDYFVCYQESTSIPILNPVQSLVFITGILPISSGLIQPPKVYGANSGLYSNGNNSNISPVITDFEVNVSNLNTYKNSVNYTNQGEYRLIDLNGQTPVGALELSVFWRDQFGGLHPLKLWSGCNFNCKIMFRRKDFGAINLGL